MARQTAGRPPATVTPNQVVSYRLREARQSRQWTQAEAANRLAPYLGARWSRASFSAAESGTLSGRRVRVFSANELLAFARGFELPVLYFLLPPPGSAVATADGGVEGLDPGVMIDAVFGTDQTMPALEDAVLTWVGEYCGGVTGPADMPPWLAGRVGGLISQLVELVAPSVSGATAPPAGVAAR